MMCSLTQGQQWRAHSNNALSSCIIGQTVQGGQVAKGTSQLDTTVEGNATEGWAMAAFYTNRLILSVSLVMCNVQNQSTDVGSWRLEQGYQEGNECELLQTDTGDTKVQMEEEKWIWQE